MKKRCIGQLKSSEMAFSIIIKKKSFFRLITLLKAPKRVVVTNLSTIPQFIRGFN